MYRLHLGTRHADLLIGIELVQKDRSVALASILLYDSGAVVQFDDTITIPMGRDSHGDDYNLAREEPRLHAVARHANAYDFTANKAFWHLNRFKHPVGGDCYPIGSG